MKSKGHWKYAGIFCVLSAAFAICFAGVNPSSDRGRIFEGRISARLTRDNQTEELRYAIATNFVRVESTATNRPMPSNILDRRSGELIIVFPHNGSFMRVKPGAPSASPRTPPMPAGIGPQSAFPMVSAGAAPGMAMVPMPPMGMERLELRDLNEKTNLLGYACEHFQIHQRNATMDIWATDAIAPFQPYLRSQPIGASTPEEKWGELIQAKGEFPLLAILKSDNGLERLRFEVTSVIPQKLMNESASLFQPPANYRAVLPLPY